jgi:Regulatory subunit of type II PKA R-subunit
MADVREMRIFSADQIEVPADLPTILKDYSKEVIRNNPKDLVKFSREYFDQKVAEKKAGAMFNNRT